MINIRINRLSINNITFTLCFPSLCNTFHAKEILVQLNKGFSEIIVTYSVKFLQWLLVMFSIGMRTPINNKLPLQPCFEIEHEVNSKMAH